jgi:hypothetical protein
MKFLRHFRAYRWRIVGVLMMVLWLGVSASLVPSAQAKDGGVLITLFISHVIQINHDITEFRNEVVQEAQAISALEGAYTTAITRMTALLPANDLTRLALEARLDELHVTLQAMSQLVGFNAAFFKAESELDDRRQFLQTMHQQGQANGDPEFVFSKQDFQDFLNEAYQYNHNFVTEPRNLIDGLRSLFVEFDTLIDTGCQQLGC